MGLDEILIRYREGVIKDWVHRLSTQVSSRYARCRLEELFVTVSAAYDASCMVLVHDVFSMINCHVEWIARSRLLGGFSLSEVQNAYELYRTILYPVLLKELEGEELFDASRRLNACLFYTLTRFSDYYQSLHEKQIRDYARNLEAKVMERTKELAESESQYRVLIEEINDGYFVNQDGIIVFANGAFCEIHGYAVSEVIGRPYINFIAQESLSEVQKLYEERISKGYADDLYVYFRHHKNGSSLPTENKVKLMTYHGESAVAGICRDITERMEMEGRIRESESLAHIGQLTTSLAHEIRNPLSSVKMNIQILLKNIQFSGNDKRRMEIMASEISRLERILAEMLDFARPLRLNLSSASINEIIDACLEIMDVRVNEKNLVVKKRYSKNIPYTLMDHDKIEQAIINVLLNSVEALKGGGEIKVTTKRVIKDGEIIIVEIGDNGPGINSEDLPYVFDPFFSNKRKGTGLGLSNTKKIIEAHGGMVAVAKEKKRGLLCRFSIPVRERPYE